MDKGETRQQKIKKLKRKKGFVIIQKDRST